MKKKSIILTIVFVGIVVLAFLTLKKNKAEVVAKVYKHTEDHAVFVKVETVEEKPFSVYLNFMGTLYPYQETNLNSSLSAIVKAVYFKEGDYVTKGQTLAQLDDDLLRADYTAAQIALKKDSIEYTSYLNVSNSAKGSVSDNQLNQLLAKWGNAKSIVEKIKKQLELSTLKAPFSGYITMKNIELGSLVSPISPFARVSNLSTLKMVAFISESDIRYLHLRQSVLLDAQGTSLTGNIIYISQRADNMHKYEVHIEINNSKGELKSGQYANFKIKSNTTQKALTIQRSSLLGSIRNPQVYVIKNNIASLVSIEIGNVNQNEIEVRKGLKKGDVVVNSGQINLYDGAAVNAN